MQQFRNLLKGWVGKVLLFIFILPFAFFGIEGIFNSGSKQDVAIEVNGVEISKMEVSRAIQNQRNNLKAQMGGNIDDSFFSDEMLAPGVIENLIQRELLKQALQNDGLTVAPDLVKSYVRSMPQFQDEQGNFSNERLEIALVQANYTKLKLYSVVQESMVMEQLQAGVGASAFITDSELERLAKLNGQTRDASYAKFEVAPLKETIELTEEEKQAYYEENKAQYRTEEKIKLEYVALSRDDFKGEIEVTEDELNSAYDDYVAGQADLERRRASHILVEINDDRNEEEAQARIKEAQQKLVGGEDFASVAKTFSDDIATSNNGGDLDFAGRGVYDEAFEQALFSLADKNQVSDIVQTEFGFHLIKLTDVQAQEIASFDAMKDTLSNQILETLAQDQLDAALDELNRLAYEAGDLQVISEQYNKSIETTELFTRQGGTGIAADNTVITAGFSETVLQEGLNSEALELADGRVAVIKLLERQEPRDLTFEEVADQVTAALTQEKARELAKSKADEIVAKVEEGVELATIAEEYGLEWKEVNGATRTSSDLPRTAISALFEMSKPAGEAKSVKKVSLPNGDQEVLILNAVKEGEFKLEGAAIAQAKAAAANQLANSDFTSYIASLRESAEIKQY